MASRRVIMSMKRREQLVGYLFISPWFIGFLAFTLVPVLASLYLSFTDYDFIRPLKWVGWDNYEYALFSDPLFWKSVTATLVYVLMTLPLNLVLGLFLALLLNARVYGSAVFRTIYYLPAILPGVALSILWRWLFNTRFGPINLGLGMLGIQGPAWLTDEFWVMPALAIMNLWALGSEAIIYLASLRNIPMELYEAATLDGALGRQRFRFITLPLITPAIFVNLTLGIIGSFRVFTQAFVMTGGGPNHATFFYMFYLYHSAFSYLKMGYASALAWILFAISLALVALVLRSSSLWIYYDSEFKGKRW